jgi:hypothetical protein
MGMKETPSGAQQPLTFHSAATIALSLVGGSEGLWRTLGVAERCTYGQGRTIIETVMEHRWGSRRAITHAVRVRTQGGLVASGILKNISVSGALLTTDAPLRLSGHLEVQLFAKSKVVRPLTAAAAHVVRMCPEGYGIEWAELSPPALRFLTEEEDGENYSTVSTAAPRRLP